MFYESETSARVYVVFFYWLAGASLNLSAERRERYWEDLVGMSRRRRRYPGIYFTGDLPDPARPPGSPASRTEYFGVRIFKRWSQCATPLSFNAITDPPQRATAPRNRRLQITCCWGRSSTRRKSNDWNVSWNRIMERERRGKLI